MNALRMISTRSRQVANNLVCLIKKQESSRLGLFKKNDNLSYLVMAGCLPAILPRFSPSSH